jgi:hypothetical protein
VTDEQHRRLVLALDVHQQLGHGRLHRHVERRHRLVGHHDLGLPAKARATPMRCFWPPESWRGMLGESARQLHEVEQFQHALAPVVGVLP